MRRRLLFACTAVITACGGPTPPPATWVQPSTAVLSTDEVHIEAIDGSFALAADDPAPTPFWTHDCPAQPTTGNYELGRRLGAQAVRIRHPSLDEPLYGLLAFCHVHPDATGPVTRSYDVQVPASRVAQTSAGRISVVWEPYGVTKQYADGAQELPAWVLWLSRTPPR